MTIDLDPFLKQHFLKLSRPFQLLFSCSNRYQLQYVEYEKTEKGYGETPVSKEKGNDQRAMSSVWHNRSLVSRPIRQRPVATISMVSGVAKGSFHNGRMMRVASATINGARIMPFPCARMFFGAHTHHAQQVRCPYFWLMFARYGAQGIQLSGATAWEF